MSLLAATHTASDEATLFKFGVHVDLGLFLPADQKLAPKWAWPGERAQFRNFGTPSICLYRMKLHSLNLVCSWILGCSCPRTTNWPPSGRGLGNVSNFEIYGTPSISLGRMKPRFSNFVRTWRLGCSCTRTTNWPRSGRGLGYVPNFEISGPPQYVCIEWSYTLQIWCTNAPRTVIARGSKIMSECAACHRTYVIPCE